LRASGDSDLGMAPNCIWRTTDSPRRAIEPPAHLATDPRDSQLFDAFEACLRPVGPSWHFGGVALYLAAII